MAKIILLLAFTLLSGCNSLGFKPIVQNVATSGVAYAIGGPIPAIANAAVMITTEEFIAEDTKVGDIESTPQALAYVAEKGIESFLWLGIFFLVLTNIIVPFLTKKLGYAKAKQKYKEVVFNPEEKLLGD